MPLVALREIGWELPHYIPFDATKALIRKSINRWREPTVTCFEGVFEGLAQTVASMISFTFERFPPLQLCIRYKFPLLRRRLHPHMS
jgi:vacuolar protein sorting-associated protein 1